MKESRFQANLIKELKELLPGCIILKNDANYKQGIPDILILYGDRWAALEVKQSSNSNVQPNQAYYVDLMDEMSYAAFIYPENRERRIDELLSTLRS